ncbi:MAG: hypothetical protein BYD32DRAFT_474601 [Podila humilis]|nr:MAG: hypothetical protein BYD32DRAFT_474601 [Podila humilis]
MAEAVFKHAVEMRGISSRFEVDSTGMTSYHAGNQPRHSIFRDVPQERCSIEAQDPSGLQ